MKILEFQCDKVHGYLTFTLIFNPDLTFITGINGSGKTSAVRATTALLTPSITDLVNLNYKKISVTVEHEGQTTITAQRSEEELTISCSGVDGAFTIPVLRPRAYEPRARFLERERDFYREQEAINARNPVLSRLERLPTPMFLDLERRHQAGTRQRRAGERVFVRAAAANPLAGSLIDSLGDAQELAEETFRQFLAMRAQLTDELKQEIILAAFRPSTAQDTGPQDFQLPSKPFMRQVERNEDVVNLSLSQIGISPERIDKTVKPFFEHVREVASRLPKALREGPRPNVSQLLQALDEATVKNLQEWSAIDPQVRQINRLVELISTYNDDVRGVMEPVERYRNSINGFLADSGKELIFDKSGNLQVAIAEDQKPRPITALSSGERQLVVILTHLAFNRQAKRANVLIIDEPELSLHLRWQEQFVDAVASASPGVQLILATHSPSIIKGRIDRCVDVEEARRSDRVLT
jgi:predicted ATP-binding protein involved in virulence